MSKKIPKIKSNERVKIVNAPELLIVAPLTWNDSARYGHRSNWCTSVDEPNWFTKHMRTGVLVYVIFYEKKEKTRVEKTKIALNRNFRGSRSHDYDLYDMKDSKITVELLELMIGTENLNLINQYYLKLKQEYFDKLPKFDCPFKVDDLVCGDSEKEIKLSFRNKFIHLKFPLKWSDIEQARVIAIRDFSYTIQIQEINKKSRKIGEMLEMINLENVTLKRTLRQTRKTPLKLIG